MKSLLIAFVLSLSLTLAFADSPSEEEIEKAMRECNVTNPVQNDPDLLIVEAIQDGKLLHLSGVEKCFLSCLYQKLNLYDNNSKINIEVLKDWSHWDLHYDMMIATGIAVNEATRNFENKCDRGFVNFFQLMFQEFVLNPTVKSRKIAGLKQQINDTLENGKPIVTLLGQSKVKQTGFFARMSERIAQRKISHVESPLQQQAREIQ